MIKELNNSLGLVCYPLFTSSSPPKTNTMKKLHHFFSTCLLLLILYSFGFGQTSGWPTSYANLNVRAMTIDANGNIYITGPADGGKKAGLDFVTVKYAPNGHLEWSAQYNGPSS